MLYIPMTTTFPREMEILVLYVDTTTTFLVGLLLGLTPRRTTHTHTLTLTLTHVVYTVYAAVQWSPEYLPHFITPLKNTNVYVYSMYCYIIVKRSSVVSWVTHTHDRWNVYSTLQCNAVCTAILYSSAVWSVSWVTHTHDRWNVYSTLQRNTVYCYYACYESSLLVVNQTRKEKNLKSAAIDFSAGIQQQDSHCKRN